MILRNKSTQEIVDVEIVRNKDGKLCGVYWSNNGNGCWIEKKISQFVPIEKRSQTAYDQVENKVKQYRELFKLDGEDVNIFKNLQKTDRKEWFAKNLDHLLRKDLVSMMYLLMEDQL